MILEIQNSFIKGYHIHHIRPHFDVPMVVKHEADNAYDPNAHSVFMPPLENIPSSLHGAVTRPAKKSRKEQIVRDIAGAMVGRVPANLGEMFIEVNTSIVSIQW